MLSINNLTMATANKIILNKVSLSLHEKETIAIVGESGSGKSTLLKSLLGLPLQNIYQTSGAIHLFDTLVTPSSKRQKLDFIGTDVAWLTQQAAFHFNPKRQIKAHYQDLVRAYQNKVGHLRSLEECLTLVDFKNPQEIMACYPFELSGGMLQRAALALTLVAKPRLLLADEPTSALDAVSKTTLIHLLKQLNTQEHMAILFVTHDIQLARQLADKIIVMKDGQIVEQGDTATILTHPKEAYTQKLLAAVPTLAYQ